MILFRLLRQDAAEMMGRTRGAVRLAGASRAIFERVAHLPYAAEDAFRRLSTITGEPTAMQVADMPLSAPRAASPLLDAMSRYGRVYFALSSKYRLVFAPFHNDYRHGRRARQPA